MTCPHCKAPFSAEFIAKAADESRVVIAVTPAAGEMFDIMTLGGLLRGFARLLRASGASLGADSTILLEKVESGEGGQLVFRCIVARVQKGEKHV